MSHPYSVSFFAASLLLAASATALVLPAIAFGPYYGLAAGGTLLFLLFWRLCYIVATELGA
jgi:hypothetical protein